MRTCAGITQKGERCSTAVEPAQQYCYHHDPSKAEQRKRIASKGGKTKPSKLLTDLRQRLIQLSEEVYDGGLDPKVGSVCGQLLNLAIRATETQRRIYESEELERRIEALEAESAEEDYSRQSGYSTWRR
jgi:hypothetical protein